MVVLPLLAACMDIDEQITVNSDGSARWQMELSLGAFILSLAQRQGEQDDVCPGNETRTTEVGEARFKSFARGEDLVCQITLDVEEVTFLNFSKTMAATAGQEGFMDGLTVQDFDNGTYRIAHDFSPLLEGETNAEMLAIAPMLVQGRSIKVTLNAARILDSNGEISADGTQVIWELPMSLALNPGASVSREFYAEFDIREGWFDWLWRLLGFMP